MWLGWGTRLLAGWNAPQPGSLAFPSVNIDQKPMPTTASHKIASAISDRLLGP
jgi:hypothetical protein